MELKYFCEDENLDQMHKAHAGDAGFDIRCAEHTVVVPAREAKLIHTKLHLAIPEGWVGIVKPRSGLAVNNGIDVGAGVIDSGYRGEVCVLLFNHADEDFVIRYGDRIAQLVVIQHIPQNATTVLSLEELPSLDGRDSAGFGSTGVN